jgi:ATP-dependent exoDNAse (exonuclease V) alpha subunit
VKQSGEPFGGIQIVLVGDFFQLPPIVKKENDTNQNKLMPDIVGTSGIFACDSGAWSRARLVVCYLTEQHRQDDTDFLSVLSAIRSNNVSEEHRNYINSRQIDNYDMPENVTKLFSHNFNVDNVNSGELSKIEDASKNFEMTASGNDKLVEILKKGCLSPENLELKVGAVVMCTKNNQKEHFANGTLGTVVGFDEFSGYPIIKTHNGFNVTISPMDWAVEENGKIRAQITQVPLRLAWAITVHKSQGMSLNAAVMDLSQVFEYGQGYVALSRVRSLSGLYILGINEQALKVSPKILEKDVTFKKQSEEAAKVFGKVSATELKKMQHNFILACGGKIKKQNKKDMIHK